MTYATALDEAIDANAERQRAKRHVMNVMDRTGHTTVTWDPRDPASVNDAREKFDEMIGSGYTAFAIEMVEDATTDGGESNITVEQKGRRMSEFDPKVGKVMMIPQLRGG